MAGAMIVHRSNRIESLVDALEAVVVEPPADPLAPEWIAVQGRGMERWLSMELARRLGIWANPKFPFPRRVFESVTVSVLGERDPEPSVFEPSILRWAIAEILPQQLDREAFAPIRRYLERDPRGVRRIQLAGRIADLFDQYAVYRPHMVLRWERGADADDWQAELWRTVVRTHGNRHAPARARALLRALADGRTPGSDFPRRLSFFGLTTLPPLYVQILAALAGTVELHLFLLSPSREYWGEIRSRREGIRALARRAGDVQASLSGDLDDVSDADDPETAWAAEEAEAIDEGHPLLASLGRVGRDFQYVLESQADYQDAPADRYVEPHGDAMLAVLQADILALRTRGAAHAKVALRGDDDSISVHACHGAMREVEVLHDQLLTLFDRHPALSAADVVVMTPSIETYAPLIEAVFGSGGRPAIPYKIADRRPRTQHEVLDAFLRALELLRGRLPAPAVLDLLALEPVRGRFGVAAEDLERLRLWVSETGIRWGADAEQRDELGQPPCEDNTWRFGLDRLLLGYALPGDERLLFEGVLPYDDVEGSDAQLLGRLAELIATISRFRTDLREARSPAEWRRILGGLLAALVAETPTTAHQHQAIVAALDALAAQAAAGAFSGLVDLDAMRSLLESEIERAGSPRGFLVGAVTFCEMVPMRTIPFRVVALLGLNDGAFPRARRPLSFDRMAARPQRADRSARDDDRYLFLEALLAARDHLIVTYVGQSISDNTELPPSVVVNELLDALDQTFVAADAVADGVRTSGVRAQIVRRHPLQPFSPSYFVREQDGGPASYASANYRGALALAGPRAPRPPMLAAPLPTEPIETVTVDELVRFFENPTRWFLQRTVGVYLPRDAELLADREPIELNQLDRWRIGDAMLRRGLAGDGGEDTWPLLRAGGSLPLGAPGRCVFDDVAGQAARLAASAIERRAGERLPPEEIDLSFDGLRLTGTLRDVWPGGIVVAQYSRLGGRHELSLWIRHLARLAATSGAAHSVLVGRPLKGDVAIVRFRPVTDAAAALAELLRLYRVGQAVPLPFFSRASRVFVETLRDPKGSPDAAMKSARAAFAAASNSGPRGDADDAFVAELYPLGAPFDVGLPHGGAPVSFADAARAVFEPFFAHYEASA
jgi:exodeoxyribonuclease V gamma subunit